jgi:hypothetical protein
LSWRSTTPYVSIPYRLFWLIGPTEFLLVFRNTFTTLLSPLAAWIPPSPIVFSHRNSCHQADDICLNNFGLFGECVCIHCFDCSLVPAFTNET